MYYMYCAPISLIDKITLVKILLFNNNKTKQTNNSLCKFQNVSLNKKYLKFSEFNAVIIFLQMNTPQKLLNACQISTGYTVNREKLSIFPIRSIQAPFKMEFLKLRHMLRKMFYLKRKIKQYFMYILQEYHTHAAVIWDNYTRLHLVQQNCLKRLVKLINTYFNQSIKILQHISIRKYIVARKTVC